MNRPVRHRICRSFRSGAFVRVAILVACAAGPAGAQTPIQRNLEFTALPPCRLIDTRDGSGASTSDNGPIGPLANPGPHLFRLQGFCIPQGARAAELNFSVISPSATGDLRAFPADGSAPTVATMSYQGGILALSNSVTVPLATVDDSGDKDLQVLIGMVGTGHIQLVIDVTGYFAPPGTGPLWGRGRGGIVLWVGADCVNGSIRYGLSGVAVEWGNAAAACQRATWVCSSADRGLGVCDTGRLDDMTCDRMNCSGGCLNDPINGHLGWLANQGDGQFSGLARDESGTSANVLTCSVLPVWCCSWNPPPS